MGTKNYKFRFYINARHVTTFNGIESKRHPHTWEVVVHLKKESIDIVKFSNIEKDINTYFGSYHDKLLNEMHPFNLIMPTMENMGIVFFKDVKELLEVSGWELDKLEISENPTRTFVLTEQSALDFIELNKNPDIEQPVKCFNSNMKMVQDEVCIEKSNNNEDQKEIQEKRIYWAEVHRSIEERRIRRKQRNKNLKRGFLLGGIILTLGFVGLFVLGHV